MTATYLWAWRDIDQTQHSDPSGWGWNDQVQLQPGKSLQRVIFRVGCAGAAQNNSGTQTLPPVAFLGTFSVFLFDPAGTESRPLWSQHFGMACHGVTENPVAQVLPEWHSSFTWASPACEFDAQVRKRVELGTTLFLGYSLGAVPVPVNQGGQWLADSTWRVRGHLQWLLSSTA